jgi:hypothetical protein
MAGFRLGIDVSKDAEIVDFAAPHGVWSVAESAARAWSTPDGS